jgi:hypothetical protein
LSWANAGKAVVVRARTRAVGASFMGPPRQQEKRGANSANG